MNGIARSFMVLAVLSALVGMGWGIQMSISHDHGLSPAHAHLNLLGWVTLSIFAIYYQLVPQAADTRLARVHLWLAGSGVVVIVPGIVLALAGTTEALAAIGSFLTLGSMVVFGVTVLRSVSSATGLGSAGVEETPANSY